MQVSQKVFLLCLLSVWSENPSFPSLSSYPQKCFCPSDDLRCPSFDPFPYAYFFWTHGNQIATLKNMFVLPWGSKGVLIFAVLFLKHIVGREHFGLGTFRDSNCCRFSSSEAPASHGSPPAPEPQTALQPHPALKSDPVFKASPTCRLLCKVFFKLPKEFLCFSHSRSSKTCLSLV